jgi:BirA family transcriptional regulator, biotin operon repressor / biotin---[acetyl-CoA-carboxylase] ligase
MAIPREEWHLDTHHLGRRVLLFDCLDSTSTQAAALADDCANDGVVVLTEEQTAGRGQHGRTWFCQPGVGVLLSVLLFPPPELRRPVILAAWAANAVCETIRESTGLQAKIKWPNDVLVRGRKVCGILIEQGRGTVVGIGLNVNQTAAAFAAARLPEAGSLALFAERFFDCHDVARLLIRHLDGEYKRLCEGDRNRTEANWRRRLGLLGKQVLVECHDAVHCGRLRALTWEGLHLQLSGGESLRLMPESVRHLKPA